MRKIRIKVIRWLIYFILAGFNAFLCGVWLMSALKAIDALHALAYAAAGFLSGYACYLVWKSPPDKAAP